MNFTGFDDWIPIFRGGKQTDSKGVEHDGDDLIDKALANFNTAQHEPPACIGHPADDAPAWGWVEGLKKKAGGVLGEPALLLARFKQIQPEFEDMIKQGKFKKRSAAFYPDGTLRHVAFLGAMPPAVKGLPDVAFAEGAVEDFEYSETQNKKEVLHMNFKEKLKAFLSSIGFDVSKIPDEAIPGEAPAATGREAIQYSEADLEKIRTDAEAKGKQAAQAEFAEQQRQTRLSTISGEIAAFCESLIKAGKITPATVAFGLPQILFSLAGADNQIEFGETKEKATPYERMKALLESATPLVHFGEVATRDKDAGGAGSPGQKLEILTRTKMTEKKDLTYAAAFAEVQKENPDLTHEYQAEFQGQ